VRSPRFINPLIAAYIVAQLLLPIRGLKEDKFDTFGAFTWNMYSQTYGCEVKYNLVDEAGLQSAVAYQKYFASNDKVFRVFHRDVLPSFNKFLCDQVAEEGKRGRITGFVKCTKNAKESATLVSENADICTAANYAVTAK
jgi:hypothetical protein